MCLEIRSPWPMPAETERIGEKLLKEKDMHRLITIGISVYYELTEAARKRQKTEAFKKDYYQHRSGVEGPLSALVRGHGMRMSRYIGHKKHNLQAVFTGCAANIKRASSWLAGKRPQTRRKKSWSLTSI